MQKRKKILSLFIKVLVGIGSFGLIYYRLRNDFTPDKLHLLWERVLSRDGMNCLLLSVSLIPVNWGIESYKWKIITAPIQWISFKTAIKSVYSGVFLGNLAPGRATEFLAKIIYFKIDNRPRITVLHFVGGMFQLSITIIAGFLAFGYKVKDFGPDSNWLTSLAPVIGLLLLLALVVCILKINTLLNFIARKISKDKQIEDFHYRFTLKSLGQLFGFSLLRYCVFFLQFYLLLLMFEPDLQFSVVPGIALYFLITTTIPMISVLEAAIRAAVALVVFKDSGLQATTLALSSVLIWLVNIIIPSIAGYYFLLKQNFNFKLFKTKKTV